MKKLEKLDKIDNSVDFALQEIKKIVGLEETITTLKKDVGDLTSVCTALKVENNSLNEQLLKQEL